MNTTSIVVYFLVSAFCYYITSSVWAYWRLRHFKGPRLAAWTNLWWIGAATSRKSHVYLHHVCQKYGTVVRIGPNLLVTSDHELLRKMNSVRSTYSKSDWFKAFRFDADRENLFSETNEEKHIRMRQKVSAGYSGKENPNLEPDVDRQISILIDLIKSKYISKGANIKPLDFGQIIQYLMLDIITALSLGKPFGWLADEEDKYKYIQTMAENVPVMNIMSAVPILSRITRIPAVQRALLPTVKDRIGMGKIKAVARHIISDRFGSESEKVVRNDMTQSFINHGLTQAEIADESLLQILAGSDTSGTILRSAFVYIISNPRIYNRLQKECQSASVPLSQIIPHTKALDLPYLNACLKETLRYHPAAMGLSPRIVGPGGDTHNGMYFPPGTEIGVSVWDMHRCNTIYGADAIVFRPERWLEADAETLASMEKAQEVLFGYGRYKCLGERIAKIEMLKTIFELMRRFEFGFVDPMKPLEREENFGLWLQKGMWLRVEEQSN